MQLQFHLLVIILLTFNLTFAAQTQVTAQTLSYLPADNIPAVKGKKAPMQLKEKLPKTLKPNRKDKDGDGVTNKADACPEIPGSVATNGCPDKDGDGIKDELDRCPDVSGLANMNGCPDTDGDGIPDIDDECPEYIGVMELKGCPDRDEDGVADKFDACTDIPGDKLHKGCPDSDGDGIYDYEDECPQAAGAVAYNGCPFKDKDGDGVLDKQDNCPETFGAKDNGGCPKLLKKESDLIKLAEDNIVFEKDKDVLKAPVVQWLNKLAKLLNEKPAYILLITFFDNPTSGATILQQKRAEVVRRYLIGKGVDSRQLESKVLPEQSESSKQLEKVSLSIAFK